MTRAYSYSHVKVGDVNGALTIVEREGFASDGKHIKWKARCACGELVRITTGNFRAGRSCMKCGRERTRQSRLTQGGASLSHSAFRKLWDIHRRMIRRCNDTKADNYRWYGGKGIQVCPEWRKFKMFRAWAESHGYEPGLTIERKNTRLDYCPTNCEWITKSENSHRARVSIHADAAFSGVLSFGA